MVTLYINVGNAVFTRKNGKALYLAFTYDVDLYNKVLNLPIKHFHPNLNMWEVPYKHLQEIQYIFADYEIVVNDKKVQAQVNTYKDSIKGIKTAEKRVPFFKTKPFKHQVEGFLYAQNHPRFLLADDQGLGKTKQALDIAVNRKHEFKHTLIVCGVNSLKWNWYEETYTHTKEDAYIIGSYVNRKGRLVQGGMKRKIDSLMQDRKEFFLVTNMESLRNAEFLNILEEMTSSGEIGMVVIDEIHKMKNPSSAVGKSIHKLNSYYKMALTGTPMKNNVLDLFNIFKWLGEELGTLTNYKFKYCRFGGYANKEILGYQNLDELHDRLNKIQLRRLKDDVLDLPPKIHTNVYVELDSAQKKLYTLVEAELIQNINEIVLSNNPLAKTIRLRQITGYPAILDESIGYGAKLERLKEMVDEVVAQGHKVLVFSNWTDVTTGAKKILAEHKPLMFTGDEKEEDRNNNKLLFQKTKNENMVLIGTIGAMGTGHTLHAAGYVFFLDDPWSPADKVQAEDRAHRMGLTHDANIISLITKNTIDESIVEHVYQKKQVSDFVVDGKLSDKLLVKALLGLS